MARNPNRLPDDRRAPVPDPDDPAETRGNDDAAPDFQPRTTDLHGGVDVAEYVQMLPDPDAPELIPTEDGGVLVQMGQPYERPQSEASREWFENLAEVIPDIAQQSIVTDLMRRIEMDKEARSKRDEQYEEGLRRTGLGKDAPGGAQFEGASRVVHPMLTEACIDYESRIIKELWPVEGPAKAKIVGVVTPEKTSRAERKVQHMNWQLVEQIKEAKPVLETTLTQVPLGGVQYIRQWWDHRLKRPRWAFVPIDDVYLPFTAADFNSSHRWTYREVVPEVEYQQRVDQGLYRDTGLPAPTQQPDASRAEAQSNKIEGKEDPSLNLDGEREIWTVMAWLEVGDELAPLLSESGDEEQDGLYPYLIAIDVSGRKMLSWYRNWEQGDETRDPIPHLYEFPFIPWRGALAIGFPQIIGGLSGAATGALRALLDSAHANNAVTAFVLKGTGLSGTSASPQVGEMIEIDGGLETDDIRKRVMPPPFNPPSPVLFQLLGFVTEAAKGTVRTSMDENVNPNSQVPVGTQLSRLEEGLVVFSAVHARAHDAFNRILSGLHRLNKLYLPDTIRVNREGTEIMVKRTDYDGPCDVQPVSDPTIYSDQQRFGQIMALEESAVRMPMLFDMREIQKRKLKLWKISDIDAILKPEPKPQELNAVNENLAMTLGRPVAAFPEQNHVAHLKAHLAYLLSPVFGMNPIMAPRFLPLAIQHCIEHMGLLYVHSVLDAVKQASGGIRAVDLMSNDESIKRDFDLLLAEATATVVPGLQGQLGPAVQELQQAMQLLQQLAPKPQLDPAAAAVAQAAMAETQRKALADQADAQLNRDKLALEQAQTQVDILKARIAAETKIQTTQMDNQTAEEISTQRLSSGEQSHFVNGESLTAQ